MQPTVIFLFATILVGPFVAGVGAQKEKKPEKKNDVSIAAATGGKSSISVSGDYTVEDGYEVVGIDLIARPAGGKAGEGGEAQATFKKGTFRGSVDVPKGKYDVQALLTLLDKNKELHHYCSEVKTVTVPDPRSG